jgi:hypothetical protein
LADNQNKREITTLATNYTSDKSKEKEMQKEKEKEEEKEKRLLKVLVRLKRSF